MALMQVEVAWTPKNVGNIGGFSATGARCRSSRSGDEKASYSGFRGSES